MHYLLPIAAILLLMFAYRLRGGGYYAFGADTPPRLIWMVCFEICFALLAPAEVSSAVVVLTGIAAFVSISAVPHAFAQAMGRGEIPEQSFRVRWPAAIWIPACPIYRWRAWRPWQRTLYDFGQMACIALVRGCIVYAPFVFFTHDIAHTLIAIAAIALLQPLSYLIGYLIPFSLPSNVARSTEWGETFTGLSWAFSLLLLTRG